MEKNNVMCIFSGNKYKWQSCFGLCCLDLDMEWQTWQKSECWTRYFWTLVTWGPHLNFGKTSKSFFRKDIKYDSQRKLQIIEGQFKTSYIVALLQVFRDCSIKVDKCSTCLLVLLRLISAVQLRCINYNINMRARARTHTPSPMHVLLSAR